MTLQQISDGRAVSPVVGVALLIAITVILASVIGTVVLGTDVGPVDAPQATLSFKAVDNGSTVELYHEGGEPLEEDEIVVVDENGTTYEFTGDLVTGERKEIDLEGNDVERLSVVWRDPASSSETVLGTFRP